MTYDVLLGKVYDAFYDCLKKKRGKRSAIEFTLDYEYHIRKLTNELWDGTYKIGKSIAFAVTIPKLREIFAAAFRDRVVHHLVINEIGGILDIEMIDDSFSCRVGRGVQFGIKRLQEQIIEVSNNYTTEAFTLSCDISGFFMSIDKNRCYRMIEDVLNLKYEGVDLGWWLWLARMIITNRPERNCEIHGDPHLLEMLPDNKTLFRSNGKGFPIGNLTSQIFGNFYLTMFDKWSIEYIGEKGRYCRYVDDMRVTSQDKRLLMNYLHDARIWLAENMGLSLHPNKWSMQSVHKGIPFIGAIIKPWGVYAGNRLVGNAFAATQSDCDIDKYVIRLNSYFGFLIHELTYGIRWNIWKSVPSEKKKILVCYDMKKVKIRNNLKA